MNLFDLGQSRFYQGEYLKALEALEAFCALPDVDKDQYVEAIILRLRVYIETDRDKAQESLLTEVQPILSSFGHYGLSIVTYIMGYSAYYQNRHSESLSLLEKSVGHAMESQELYPLFLSLFGCAFTTLSLKKSTEGIEGKIGQLETIAKELHRSDLEISLYVLKSRKALIEKQGAKSLNYIWQAYDLVKKVKNNFLNVSIIATIGYVYLELGDKENATIYLNLADKMVDPENYKKLFTTINKLKSRLGVVPTAEFDLILDEQKKVLIEKSKGPIELKNQFILVDLMRLLMQNPGVAFSKEELTERLWQTKYNPAVHDNSIYVTIKRVRSLIEPDSQQSKYILRSRQGYLLNQDLKLAIYPQKGPT